MHGCSGVVVSAMACVAACAPGFEVNIPERNAPPYASAGTGSTYAVGDVVMLDGTGSFDPDGHIQTYRWEVAARPMGGVASIAVAAAPMTTYALDVAGQHTLSLTVVDDGGLLGFSQLKVVADAPELFVNAGSDSAIEWKVNSALAGSVTVEAGYSLTGIEWTIVSGPSGGAMLANATTLTPTFSCTVEGLYGVRLTATTAYNSASDDVVVDCSAPRQVLPSTLVDAEYSLALDRYVLVSTGPSQLHLHNPATGTTTAVALPHAPQAVSVSPNGLLAAIGHAGYVTTVNLQTMAVVATYTMSINVAELVYGGDGRIHCFDRAGFSAYHVWSINTANAAITNNMVYADGYTQARLHPDGNLIYGTRTGSPGDIVSFGVSTSPITSRGDSPYHGEYRFDRNVWFLADGTTIITGAATMFYSSMNAAVDMTYRATLANALVVYWAVDSAPADRIAALTGDFDNNGNLLQYVLQTYDNDTFAPDVRMPFPPSRSGGATFVTEPKWVAYRSDGSKLYVIGHAYAGVASIYTLFTL